MLCCRYVNTTAVKSKISFIDGDKGILRYRGYPIEQLAERSNFLEVCHSFALIQNLATFAVLAYVPMSMQYLLNHCVPCNRVCGRLELVLQSNGLSLLHTGSLLAVVW